MGATPESLYFGGSSEASALPVRTVQGADAEAQRAARDAIMQIRLFPDLTVALRGALGYGPHVDMLQHFCYWMHPRHPKMQSRWTMYKTYAEWRDECALSDRQVRKGRKVLRELGLVTEKKSNYGRIDYRVNWVALAEALRLNTSTVQTDEDLDDFDLFGDDDSLDGITAQGQFGRYSDESSLDANTVQANAGEHAGDYLQKTTLLQRAPEPAFAEPGAPEINKDKEPKVGLAPPSEDKRHSKNGRTPSETTAVRDVGESVVIPPKPDDDTLLDDVREILDPDSGRWWGATFVAQRHMQYVPETVAKLMGNLAEEIERPEVIRRAERSTLEDAVRYVMWEAEEEVG
jgi:hypothetical protein